MNRIRSALVLVGVMSMGLAACGKSNPEATNAATSTKTTFVLKEYSITQPAAALMAGKVVITATNKGDQTHELVIVRADDAASLPKKADGSVDEDQIAEGDKPGEIPDVAAGKSVSKTIDLAAGRYVAICNLVHTPGMDHSGKGGSDMTHGASGDKSGTEHVHFQLGMVTTFTVA